MNLFLRTCNADGSSWDGFVWNTSVGSVTNSANWSEFPSCGNGLHGFLMGEGNGKLASLKPDALWLVCEALDKIVKLEGKIKTKSARVLFCGSQFDATEFLISQGANRSKTIGATIKAGNNEIVIGADRSILIVGNDCQVVAGHYSKVTSEKNCKIRVGDLSEVCYDGKNERTTSVNNIFHNFETGKNGLCLIQS